MTHNLRHMDLVDPIPSHGINAIFCIDTRIRVAFIDIRATQNSKTITNESIITFTLKITNIIFTSCIHVTVMCTCQTFVFIRAFAISAFFQGREQLFKKSPKSRRKILIGSVAFIAVNA